ncbi:MAG: ABC transporter permease [Bdellovibrionaceae bacterium]|nr:ABC transporter permease [Pseudobdellovibrionaceae bacterium]
MSDLTFLKLPKIRDGYKNIWLRNFLHFKKTFLVSFFWVILEPLMYLGAIGYGLGSYIQTINGQSYVDFFFPGLLASTSMMVPFFESTYNNYTKLTFQKIYNHMMLTRLDTYEIITGELLWSTFKGFFGIVGLVFIASFFGLVSGWEIILVILLLTLNSWIFSGIAMSITSWAKNYDSFIYATSGFLIPLTLISGIYFPISQMPVLLQITTYIFPLAHTIELCRMILTEQWHWVGYFHLLYLLIAAYVFFALALMRITKKLIN